MGFLDTDATFRFDSNKPIELDLCGSYRGDYNSIEAYIPSLYYIYTISSISPLLAIIEYELLIFITVDLDFELPMTQPVQQQTKSLIVNSRSDQCFSFIRERLRTCRTCHSACNQRDDLPFPKRSLYVGKSNDELKLQDTEYRQGTYAILSYCWGDSQYLLKTTSDLLEKHKKGVLWARLPTTIQDAIQITRELTLDYLWVDSLCIIQDNEDDWEIESAKMGEYYRNAHITIAASGAANAQAGILSARENIPEPAEEKVQSADGTVCTFIIQQRHRNFKELQHLVHDFGPLSKRGWAFQENVLSTRTIHFTNSELVWECSTETILEDGWPLGNSQHSVLSRNLLALQPNPRQLWQDLITNFSRRELTYPSDRLPAIAGFAQQLQRQTGLQYVAGLWRETMTSDLLWSVSWDHYRIDDTQNLPIESPRYLDSTVALEGPSWSWASTTAAVCFAKSDDDGTHDPCATIQDVRCKITGSNPFGETTHGLLQITGPFQRLGFLPHDSSYPSSYMIHVLPNGKSFIPDKLPIGAETGTSLSSSNQHSLLLEKPIYCLQICKDYGLVLRASSVSPGVYTRIGLCKNVGSLFQYSSIQSITII